MRFRIRFADKIVGIFLIFALTSLVVVLIFLAVNQRWFEQNIEFTSRFNSAAGLNRGMAVTLRGFEIGKVKKIRLNDKNQVDISFIIYEEYHSRIREHSIIQLSTNPLGIGGGGLVLHVGKGETILPSGAFIPNLDSLEGKSLVTSGLVNLPEGSDDVSALLAQVDAVLADIPTVVSTMNQTLRYMNGILYTVDETLKGNSTGPLGTSLDRMNGILATVDDTLKGTSTGPIGESLASVKTALADLANITANLEKASEALAVPDDLVVSLVTKIAAPGTSLDALINDNKELYKRVESMLGSLEASAKDVQNLTAYLNSTRPQILGLLEETRKALDQGQDVLQGVKNNPLIKGGIPEVPVQTSPFKSYRDEDF